MIANREQKFIRIEAAMTPGSLLCEGRASDEAGSSPDATHWELWRQDDNGVCALVARYPDQAIALEALRRFESHPHKQTYWIKAPPLEKDEGEGT